MKNQGELNLQIKSLHIVPDSDTMKAAEISDDDIPFRVVRELN
jgi:hypothetical protein